MISAFFVTFSLWFSLLFITWMFSQIYRKGNAKVLDVFLYSLVFGLMATIPSFYGIYKLLELL